MKAQLRRFIQFIRQFWRLLLGLALGVLTLSLCTPQLQQSSDLEPNRLLSEPTGTTVAIIAELVQTPTPPPPTAPPAASLSPQQTGEADLGDSCCAGASGTVAGTATSSVMPSPTVTVEPPELYLGIWISAAELAALPTSGPAWEQLTAAAAEDIDEPRLSDKDQNNDIYVLAKALVYARTGEEPYREEVIRQIEAAIGTEQGGLTLALGRNLVGYVIAADLVNLPQADAELDLQFRVWLEKMLSQPLDDGRTLRITHELRPNNWGTHAGAARAAVAVYLGDEAELEQTARVFKGWLGDREAYDGFEYGRLGWQADPENPVGVNPVGATKEGHDISGALPEEMRRAGLFRWPPRQTDYAWEGLQGAIVQAEILHRAGYPAWEWEDQALLRAVRFLYNIGWEAEGDDEWQPWLINHAYDTGFPAGNPARPGKNMGWTNWTHQPERQGKTDGSSPARGKIPGGFISQ